MLSLNDIMTVYTNNNEAPSMDTLLALEERMIGLLIWTFDIRKQEAFYCGLEQQCWREVR
jgi:hypothetical protein